MIDRAARFFQPALYLASAGLLAALARLGLIGLYSRYWADDYCYSAVMASAGFLRGPVEWFMASGNRFSTIYLVGLQDLFGPQAIRVVPAAVILGLGVSMLVLLHSVSRVIGRQTAGPTLVELLPPALAQVFFFLLLAPDRLQGLYWRMGELHYTFPLALLCLLLALLLRSEPARPWPRRVLLFALAFFAGGFSETYAALQVGCLALLAGTLLVLNRDRRALPALMGGLGAVGLMLLSPSNAWRQAALPPPETPWQLLAFTWRYTLDFAWQTLRGVPLPLVFFFLLSGGMAYTIFWRRAPVLPRARIFLAVSAGCLPVGAALAACAIAPSVYAGLQFPAGRALMPALFILLLSLMAAAGSLSGALAALARSHARLGRAVELSLLLAVFAGSFYVVRHLAQPLPEQAEMAAWSQRWDERDESIRAQIAAGQDRIVVPEVEVVRGLEDLGPDPGQWVNRCAAAYYRVQSVVAGEVNGEQ